MTLNRRVSPDAVGATSLASSVYVIAASDEVLMPVVVSVVCASSDGTMKKQSNGIRERNLKRNKLHLLKFARSVCECTCRRTTKRVPDPCESKTLKASRP